MWRPLTRGVICLCLYSRTAPHPTCSVNECNESDSVKHVHSLPLMRIYIGDIKSFWLLLDVMQISVEVEDDLLYNNNLSFHILRCCQFSTCCMSSVVRKTANMKNQPPTPSHPTPQQPLPRVDPRPSSLVLESPSFSPPSPLSLPRQEFT